MSKPKTGPQDLPPKGGYAPFQIDRVKLRTIVGGRLGVAFLLATNIIGIPLYFKNWVKCRKDKIAHISSQLATFPIFFAERDRVMLRHMKRLRDMEEDVMKDFPFWEVGTLFGVPVYETLPKDTYIEPNYVECYNGTDRKHEPPVLLTAKFGM